MVSNFRRLLKMKRCFLSVCLVVLTALCVMAQEPRMPGRESAPAKPGRPEVSEDEVRRPDAKAKIVADLPKNLPLKQRARLEVLVEQSLAALRSGDSKTGIAKIKEFQTQLRYVDDKWVACG